MKKLSTKLIVLLLAVALLFGCGVGGTIAWLMTATAPVVNTFTVGNINITLTETTSDYKMIPGGTVAKNPLVTVKANSEKCYLFVKIDEANNTFDTDKKYISYTVEEDTWEPVDGVNGVYYMVVDGKNSDQPFPVLEDDEVKVNYEVTKAEIDAIEAGTVQKPTLTFTAYAIQFDNIEASGEQSEVQVAWEQAQTATVPGQ